ncbi:Coatomer subunit beta' [Coemansia sp. RSA 1937]|nr:Coatomer subunit beta' [Coemansia sp. RSA 1937]
MAEDASANNIAFTCYQSLQQNDKCLDLLLRIGRVPEAALFARSHVPARADEVAAKWKSQLIELGKNKAAEAIASPTDYANLFPDFERALTEASSRSGLLAASAYPQFKSGEVDMAVDVAVVPDGDFSTDAAVEEDTAIEIDTDAEPVLAEDVNDNVDEGNEFHEAE